MNNWYDRTAYFLGNFIWGANPVYHRSRSSLARGRDETMAARSVCGLLLCQWHTLSGETYKDWGVVIRRDYADRFARPCKKCWPGETS